MNFIAENKSETDRLRALADEIGRNWTTEVGGGWTVGTMLCHLAFWDKMTQVRINRWIQSGQLAPLPDMENTHSVNESVRSMSELISTEAGLKLVVLSADAIDHLVASLGPMQIQELETSGRERWYKRHLHRKAHLDRIETALRP